MFGTDDVKSAITGNVAYRPLLLCERISTDVTGFVRKEDRK
jgi:hypothetical protein